MKARPILFTPENAQKVHDGAKTQTRRIVKPQPPANCDKPMFDAAGYGFFYEQPDSDGDALDVWPEGSDGIKCLYGMVGDRLWVREAWRVFGGLEYEYQQHLPSVRYRGDISDALEYLQAEWRPSIHMPKWACRTWLDLTAVRVERLQDITEDDARAEGCAPVVHDKDGAVDCGTRKTIFRQLWESIHGPGSWGENPWVWVLEFKRMQP